MKTLKGFTIPCKCRLFNGISRKDAEWLLSSLGAVTVSYDKGETSIEQWSKITHHFLVVSGEVHSYYYHPDGRRTVTGAFRPGDDYGLLFAFSDMKENPSTAIATEDSIVIRIPIIDITTNNLLNSSQRGIQYIQNVVDVISQAAFKGRLRSFVVSHRTIEGRVMAYLNEKAKHFRSTSFDIPLDRQEFADFIDCDRSTLCSAISKLHKSGFFDVTHNHFVLKSASRPPFGSRLM